MAQRGGGALQHAEGNGGVAGFIQQAGEALVVQALGKGVGGLGAAALQRC